MVLDEVSGDRHLVISIGDREAFSLAARLQGLEFGRPMTYDFAAALVRGLAGHVRKVRVDRQVEGTYIATVEVEGPPRYSTTCPRGKRSGTSASTTRRAVETFCQRRYVTRFRAIS